MIQIPIRKDTTLEDAVERAPETIMLHQRPQPEYDHRGTLSVL